MNRTISQNNAIMQCISIFAWILCFGCPLSISSCYMHEEDFIVDNWRKKGRHQKVWVRTTQAQAEEIVTELAAANQFVPTTVFIDAFLSRLQEKKYAKPESTALSYHGGRESPFYWCHYIVIEPFTNHVIIHIAKTYINEMVGYSNLSEQERQEEVLQEKVQHDRALYDFDWPEAIHQACARRGLVVLREVGK